MGAGRSFSLRSKATISRYWACRSCRCWTSFARKASWRHESAIMNLTGRAKLAGIIGWPVSHSLSPVLHGHWLAEYGIDGAMVPLAARVEDFAAVIDGVRRAGFKGVNVTGPHKEAAFAMAHSADAMAQAAGAANLLVFHGAEIEAQNTDVYGLTQSLGPALPLPNTTVVLLGAGGAARGAVL